MKKYFVAKSYNLDNKKYEIRQKFFVNLNQFCFKYRAMENFILKTGIAMQ